MHHFHSLHHLLPSTLDLSVLCLVVIQLLGLNWRWLTKMNKGRNASCMKDLGNSKILEWPSYHGQNLCLMKRVKCNKFDVGSTPLLKGNRSFWLPSLIACWNTKVVKKPKCWCKIIILQQKINYMFIMNVFTLPMTTHLFWTNSK